MADPNKMRLIPFILSKIKKTESKKIKESSFPLIEESIGFIKISIEGFKDGVFSGILGLIIMFFVLLTLWLPLISIILIFSFLCYYQLYVW